MALEYEATLQHIIAESSVISALHVLCGKENLRNENGFHFKLIVYGNKELTSNSVTIEAQTFFSNSNYGFFFCV